MLNAALNDGSRKKPDGTPSVSRIAGAMLLGALGAVALVVTSGSVHTMLLTSESAPSRVTDVEPLTVYYWPMWGRAGHVFWMLDEAEYPYVHVSDKEHIAEVASAFGAMNDTFAPPIVKDGDFLLSQSVALAIYLGEKLGFDHGVPDNFKAMQHLSDLLDFFNEASAAHGRVLSAFHAACTARSARACSGAQRPCPTSVRACTGGQGSHDATASPRVCGRRLLWGSL